MKYDVTMTGDADRLRFSLTKKGKKKLIVIGVNPSTATAETSDPTITKVMGFAERNGFDGFIMLNLYPQRCTDPNKLHSELKEDLHRQNLEEIKKAVYDIEKPVILLAFGDMIAKRPYLKKCLKDILYELSPFHPQWKKVGTLTKMGNPRHLSRIAYTDLTECNIEQYLSNHL